jgi:hypothetical protein
MSLSWLQKINTEALEGTGVLNSIEDLQSVILLVTLITVFARRNVTIQYLGSDCAKPNR